MEENKDNTSKIPEVNNNIPEISKIPDLPDQNNEIKSESETVKKQVKTSNQDRGFTEQQQQNQQQYQQQYSQQQQNNYNQQQYQNQNNQQQYQGANNYAQQNTGSRTNQYKNPIKIKLPNSSGILTLGILSILSICCCGPFLGPILSIIALAMIPKAMRTYRENPELYKISSLKNLKAGKVCAIIGLVITVIIIILIIASSSMNPNDFGNYELGYDVSWDRLGY